MYGGMCAKYWHMPRIRNVGRVRPQPFFVHASRFKHSNHWALKWYRAFGFVFSIQSSVYDTTTVMKVSLFYLDTVYRMVLLYVSVEIDLFSCEQTSVI